MNKFLKTLAGALVGIALSLGLTACPNGITAQDAKDAKRDTQLGLSILQEACVIANAAFPKSTVADACGLSGPYVDLANKLLASTAAAGAAPARAYPVMCEETDAGIKCEKPWAGPAKQ